MSNNTYTRNFSDTVALTQAQLDTAFTSLKLDLAQTTQMTTGASTNTVLTASTPGGAATWVAPTSLITFPAINRDYGLSAVASSNALVISLTGSAGATPSTSASAVIAGPSFAATSSTFSRYTISSARSITVNASATLGASGTATNRVFVYAAITSTSATGVRLAVSSHFHGNTFIASSTAVAATADTAGIIYSTAALTTKAFISLGYVEAARNSSGQWQTPTRVFAEYGSDLLAEKRLTGTTVGMRGVAISSSSGSFASTSASYTDVTNLSITVTTTGKPVFLTLTCDDNSGGSSLRAIDTSSGGDATASFRFMRGTTALGYAELKIIAAHSSTDSLVMVPPGALSYLDAPVAGTYTYKLQGAVVNGSSGDSLEVVRCRLLAYEL